MHSSPHWRGRTALTLAAVVSIAVLLVVGYARGWHRPLARLLSGAGPALADADPRNGSHNDDHGDHDEHDGHDGHDEHQAHASAESIELSPEARRTLELQTGEATLGSFVRRISVPATIVPWPGRTHVTIAAPLTGTVTAVHVTRGESIQSRAPLYTLRLTHQDLVRTQSDFLQRLGEADVERQEVQRLSAVAESGAIARRSLLERQYALGRLEAELRAMRESLLLHGLSDAQVRQIENDRNLVREVTIFAPVMHADRSLHDDALEHEHATAPLAVQPADYQAPEITAGGGHDAEHIDVQFVVTELTTERGQSVEAGDPLTVLANYEVLLAEGHAFQQDAEALIEASRTGAPVQAVLESGERQPQVIEGLQVAYVGSEIRTDSRTLPFYVPLENERVRQETRGKRLYTNWRFRPGQRLRLRVPVAQLEGVIVLPVDAVAKEGAESYVFVENGDHFDRRTVEVVLQDQLNVAIANSGAIFPGETIALSDAHQLQMALKNLAGGGVDPHAGHNH